MRKHGRHGSLSSSRFWVEKSPTGGQPRRKIQLSFGSGRCLWVTDSGRSKNVIKH